MIDRKRKTKIKCGENYFITNELYVIILIEEMIILQVLKVGDIFELFYGRDMVGQDGCIFEKFKEGNEYCLVVYMSGINNKERELLRYSKILVRVIQEGNFILTMIRYGNSNLVFEYTFDPSLYKDGRMDDLLKLKLRSNLIYIIGVESNTNIIQTLRLVNMPMELLKKYIIIWSEVDSMEDYSGKYVKWVDDLDNRYSVLELWDMGVYVGKMGE